MTVTMATHTARARRSSQETDAIHADAVKMELSRVPRWPAPRKKGPKVRIWTLRIWTLCLRPIPASSMALRFRLARPIWLPMDATPGEFVTNIFPSALLLARELA